MDKEMLVDWLKNPLTWRGVTFVLGAAGVSVSPELVQQAGLVIMGALGFWDMAKAAKKS